MGSVTSYHLPQARQLKFLGTREEVATKLSVLIRSVTLLSVRVRDIAPNWV